MLHKALYKALLYQHPLLLHILSFLHQLKQKQKYEYLPH
ncbi:hypothetical protein EVA_20302 [gut metagenome]|uniref:Uncharacterized protein n=1 Tax=gut metagenome TaxID=749906 RepID=J9BVM1_9ZZZZ